jgi:glucosamine-6-phosphate isomerase
MSIEIFQDYTTLSMQVANVIAAQVMQKPDSVLCLAAGDTPRDAYAQFVREVAKQSLDVSRCTFIGLDEWVGIPPANKGSCHYFLNANLFQPLGISPTQIHLFNSLAEDLQGECRKMNTTVQQSGGIDLMLVGVGMNGHIGFNEPGVPTHLYAHVVELDETTQSVGQKYFSQATKLQKGITLGLQHLLDSRRVVVMASGRKKAEIMRKALEGPVDPEVPASIIRKHSNGITMLDSEAASLLTMA